MHAVRYFDADCGRHPTGLAVRCVNCGDQQCHLCDHYEINGRVWCEACAKPHLPSARRELRWYGGFMLKLLAVVAVIAIPSSWLVLDNPPVTNILTYIALCAVVVNLVIFGRGRKVRHTVYRVRTGHRNQVIV